jgi:3-phenylpropionate/trans-cinnamate dioxygenase ferredoxin subunit
VSRHLVGPADEIPPGSRKIVEIEGRSIGIFNVQGEYLAVRNTCPHQSGPLCLGQQFGLVESSAAGAYDYSRPGEMIRCPWHGWEYDLRTGQSWFDPVSTRVRSYEVVVASGEVETVTPTERSPGPYTAETYPVTEERRLLYIEL